MESSGAIDLDDPDIFHNIKDNIEKELSDLKKIVDNVNQMRVEAAYLESDLMVTINASTWQNISELIGLTTDIMDLDVKKTDG